MPEQSNDYRVAVFGTAGVGKSSLVTRFIKNTYKDQYTPTVEDTYRKVITNDKQVCTLQITDTTGSHQFPAMMRLAMSKGHGFIFVYSVTSRNSLVELNKTVTEVKEIKGADIAKCPMMVVANKCDETSAREVSKEAGNTIAQKWGCGFIETSAKENINVTEMFEQLLQMDKQRNMALMGDKKKKSKFGIGSKGEKTESSSKSKENKPQKEEKAKEKEEKAKAKEEKTKSKEEKSKDKEEKKSDKKEENQKEEDSGEDEEGKKCSLM